jgi:hypothetical protein
MYFDNFQDMYYDFQKPNGDIDYVKLKDITQNVRFKMQVLENISLYEYYDMSDQDTPEIVSEHFYKSPKYHWVIMIANQKYDYVEDFPMPIDRLEKRITEKYGAGNEYATHHYEYNGWIVDNISYPQASAVSNYQYEFDQNEAKRRIRIISPGLLDQVLTEFRRIM